VVTYIVRRLRELLGANERGFREYMMLLELLSENRNLRAQVEEAEYMLTEIDIERLPSFAIGYEPGASPFFAKPEMGSVRFRVQKIRQRPRPSAAHVRPASVRPGAHSARRLRSLAFLCSSVA